MCSMYLPCMGEKRGLLLSFAKPLFRPSHLYAEYERRGLGGPFFIVNLAEIDHQSRLPPPKMRRNAKNRFKKLR